MHEKEVVKNSRLKAKFFRGFTSEFFESLCKDLDPSKEDQQILSKLPLDQTLLIGFNPGFGSGYEPLLKSWCLDIVRFADLKYATFFTQANDFSDLRGETYVFENIFDKKVKMILAPEQNPFRAVTHYSDEASQNNIWCCANTHMYGMQGWADKPMTRKDMKEKLASVAGEYCLK